jgi:RNA polymerase sigma-70 factor (ECF subfamily)
MSVGDLEGKVMSLGQNQQVFDQLFHEYKQRIYWHLRKLVIDHHATEDCLQETFVKVWRFMANFKGESSLYTWIYRIATNTGLSYLEKNKKNRSSELDESIYQSIKQSSGFDEKKLEWRLQLAIASLPEKQRIVFNLRYYEEMPYEQMSQVLETSTGALKASYHHAAKKIEQYLLNHVDQI